MPVRLDQLIIKATIADHESTDNEGATTPASAGDQEASLKKVKKSVDAINEILKRKNER
jgi:hypothetical protein